MSSAKIRVAQLRGNGLSDRETKTWKYFSDDFVQTVFSTKKNTFAFSPLPFPITTLRSSSDNFFSKNFYKYFFGQYQRMFGLEKKLVNFDIVHTCEIMNYYTYQAVAAKKFNKNLKVVTTVWDNSFGRFEYNYWPGFKVPPLYWRRQIARIIKENAAGVDKFLPVTHDAAEMLKYYGAPKEKICVVAPGIVLADPGAVKNALPSQLAGKEVYLMVNRLVKEKGVYDCLFGWKRYLSKTKTAERKLLVIVGDGPERENLHRIVEEENLAQYVVFIRQLSYNEMPAIYQAAKCLILGSIPNSVWQEQFGYVLAEAICAGVPVVATYCGAIPEVVGEAGLIVPPAHPIALSNAILAMDDPVVYNKLKAGCNIEMKRFAIDKYAQTISEIYKNLI